MSIVRKVCIALILFLYLMGFPPLNAIYNKGGFILGIPTFIFGLLACALSLVGVIFFLYRYEARQEDKEDAAAKE